MLIVSMRWYLKYSNGFSTEPKYQISLRASVLMINLPGKTSLSTRERKLQKPTPIFDMYSKNPISVKVVSRRDKSKS